MTLQNQWQAFRKWRKGQRKPARPDRSRPLRIEPLEERALLVVGAFSDARVLGTFEYQGVGKFVRSDNFNATAVLLHTGRHVLTAAHMVDRDLNGEVDTNVGAKVQFAILNGTVTIDANEVVFLPKGYKENAKEPGWDIAVVKLSVPAPQEIPRYDIYTRSDEIGKLVDIVGYGRGGNAAAGERDPDGTRRLGVNVIDSLANAERSFVYDLDMPGPANGNRLDEASAAHGDSGGPLFLSGRIAGITSGPLTAADDPIRFGSRVVSTRVSAYARDIDRVLGRQRHWGIDTTQYYNIGNDGRPDTIEARLNDIGYIEVRINGGLAVYAEFTRTDSLYLKGSNDNDTFIVDARLAHMLMIDGQAVPLLNQPIDGRGGTNSLEIIDPSGGMSVYTIGNSQVTPADRPKIDFERIQNLKISTRNAGSAVYVDWLPAGTTVIQGGTGNDVIYVGDVKGTLDSLATLRTLFGTIGQITVHGGGGHDQVFFQEGLGAGSAVPLRTFTIDGDRVMRSRITDPKTLRRSAVILDHSGLEELTVIGASVGNVFTVKNIDEGPVVTLRGGDGGDQFVVGDSEHSLRYLTGMGGLKIEGKGGIDFLTIDDTGPAPFYTFSQTPSFQVFNDKVSRSQWVRGLGSGFTLGPLRLDLIDIQYAGIEDLTLKGGNASNFTIERVAVGSKVSVRGGPGSDAFLVGSVAQGLAGVRDVILDGGGDVNSLVIFDQTHPLPAGQTQPMGYTLTNSTLTARSFGNIPIRTISFLPGTLQKLDLYTSNGPDLINLSQTAAGMAVTINAAAGADVIETRLGNLASPVTIAGGEGADVLVGREKFFVDQGQTYRITGSTVENTAAKPITYSSIETLDVYGSNFPNVFEVRGAAHAATTTINGGNDADVVSLGGPNDSLYYLEGRIVVHGGGGADVLTIDGRKGLNYAIQREYPSFTVTDQYVQWRYVVFVGPIVFVAEERFTYDGFEQLRVLGSDAGTTYTTLSTLAGTSTEIRAGGGNDAFQVGTGSYSLGNLRGAMTLMGGGGVDSLSIDDTASTGWQNYLLNADRLERTQTTVLPGGGNQTAPNMAPLSFAGLENIDLSTSNSGGVYNTVEVRGVAAGSSVRIHGNPNTQDLFNASADSNAILGPLSFLGQGTDFAYYYDYLNNAPQIYTVGVDPANPAAQRVDRSGLAGVTYAGLLQLILITSRVGGNAVNVTRTPAGSLLSVAANDHDVVTLGMPTGHPGDQRTLSGILGNVGVGAHVVQDRVTLIADDSGGDPQRPRRTVTIEPPANAGETFSSITGLAPARIQWRNFGISKVAVRGSAADETFVLTAPLVDAVLSIDGGGGNDLYF